MLRLATSIAVMAGFARLALADPSVSAPPTLPGQGDGAVLPVPSNICKPFAGPPILGTPQLFVACGKRAVRLGVAESFTSSYNPVLKSLLIVARTGSRTQVYLLSPTAGEAMHVDQITRDLLRAAGRYADGDLAADAAPDASGFASTGIVSVSRLVPSGDKSSASIDLTAYAQRAAALTVQVRPLPANPSQPEVSRP